MNLGIDKKELLEIVGKDENSEYYKEERAIIKDKKQVSVRIPSRFVEMAKVNPKKDTITFILIPTEKDEKYKFTIKAELKRG